ncbi:MAG TPA: DNA replication/repair protein RecF [Anaerolineae bacterium]|nr:DNA replication/repair protein RecF [Anaerolineae bacterium]
MYLRHLSLTNFRAYARLELELPAGSILIHGDNAQGKTSLLEAVYYLATGKSPHTGSDRQLIHWLAAEESGTPYARLVGDVQRADRAIHLDVTLLLEPASTIDGYRFRKQIKLNGSHARLADLAGQVSAVLFQPQDVDAVAGSPGERRRYLDNAVSQVDPDYARAIDRYADVLAQRNALLKQLQESEGTPDGADQLAYWDDRLAADGAAITLKRQIALDELSRLADRVHRDLTGGRADLRLRYQPAFDTARSSVPEFQIAMRLDVPQVAMTDARRLESAFQAQLQERRRDEINAGVTLVGPHRDEFRFISDQIDLGTYGSRGQQRTAILSLKLAEVEWGHQKTGDWPILLLDEVMSELDSRRRAYLLARLGDVNQSLTTTTDPGIFGEEYRARATQLHVISGRVE